MNLWYSFNRRAWMLINPLASAGLKVECLSMETKSLLYKEIWDDLPRIVTKKIYKLYVDLITNIALLNEVTGTTIVLKWL